MVTLEENTYGVSLPEIVMEVYGNEEPVEGHIIDIDVKDASNITITYKNDRSSEVSTHFFALKESNASEIKRILEHPSTQRCFSPWYYIQQDKINTLDQLKEWCTKHGKEVPWPKPLFFFVDLDCGSMTRLYGEDFHIVAMDSVSEDRHPFSFKSPLKKLIEEINQKCNVDYLYFCDIVCQMENWWNDGLESQGKLLEESKLYDDF